MPRMGDIAAQDAYDVPLDQGTDVGWANRVGDVLQPFTNVAAGLGRDIPRAASWFGEQARKPPEAVQTDVRGVMGGLAEQLYTLPERTMSASEQMRTEGIYNPAPAVETALTMMGGGVAGTGERAGAVLGAGPIRKAPSLREYPVAPRSEWYGDANFADTGGRMTKMTPDEFLAQSRPMKMDELTRENIDDLKAHIESGKTLDPLALYKNMKEDGRHRAHAAKELGINEVPVINWRDVTGE